jgi:hypothetical protein
VAPGGGAFTTYIPLTALSAFATQPAMPSSVCIGFTAASGGCASIHEIQNLTIS